MVLEQFIQYLQFEKRFSPHTITAYQHDLDQFFEYTSSSGQLNADATPPDHHIQLLIANLGNITYQDIREWVVQLINNGQTAKSVNRKISCLRTFFKFAMRQGVITNNPASKIQAPKIPRRLPVVIEEDKIMGLLNDAEAFTDDFAGLRDKLIIELLFGTGIRLAELVGLKETDIDLYQGTIKVLGKRNKERLVPINTELKLLLEKYSIKKKSEKFHNNSLTFIVTGKGANAYPKMIYLIVQKYLSAISTQDKKSPHVLRHTFATSMLNHGADLNAIKELLGHANLSATQIYTHNSVERLKYIYKQAHPKA
ncbi:integrase/recombinase XerC [Mucilaginibacter gracilis]|uniref:Tyrosine recombinase XerC n=1 Tax=Mucilaginibacter gracilis TaxID=423350 RepID=A0A495IZS7_9SPHI|nr:tyrosine-type recombinase/integrase [Mucilaginibacter gracilis]RKR82226.1 integrase/recombinase XerC [Mucilaginibacter gracilis]